MVRGCPKRVRLARRARLRLPIEDSRPISCGEGKVQRRRVEKIERNTATIKRTRMEDLG